MKNEFLSLNLAAWAVEDLNNRGYYKIDQLTYMSEEEILNNRILPVGTLKHLSMALEDEGIFFKNGKNALNRLHLRKEWVKFFLRNGIYDLSDLAEYSWSELAFELGFGRRMTNIIDIRMKCVGRKLA